MSRYTFKVIRQGKVVAEATSMREAQKEALRVGGVVGKSALRNPSEKVRLAEAKQYLALAQMDCEQAKSAQSNGNAKVARVYWAQTLENVAICKSYVNVVDIHNREGMELRHDANRLRELAYKNLIG